MILTDPADLLSSGSLIVLFFLNHIHHDGLDHQLRLDHRNHKVISNSHVLMFGLNFKSQSYRSQVQIPRETIMIFMKNFLA